MTTESQFAPGEVARLIALADAAAPGERAFTLLFEAQALGGDLIEPGKSSHLFELTVLGVHARGEDREELVRNWLAVARNMEGRPPAALEAQRPGWRTQYLAADQVALTRHIQARAKALEVIARPDQHARSVIAEACHLIVSTHSDAYEYNRAAALGLAIKREIEQEASL